MSLRILIVEDEMTIALLLEDMVSDLGHEAAGPLAPKKTRANPTATSAPAMAP